MDWSLSIFWLLWGVWSIFIGLRPREQRPPRTQIEGEWQAHWFWRSDWGKHLLAWHIVERESDMAEAWQEISRAWDTIKAPLNVSGGIAVLLVALGALVASLFLPKSVILPYFDLFLYFAFLLGYGIGYMAGFLRLRQMARRTVTYSDLRQRRLSDYRSGVWRWMVGSLVACNVVLVLAFWPHLGPILHLHLSGGQIDNPWFLILFPGMTVVSFIVGEVLMARIVDLPRLMVTHNPSIAQQVDDLFRASVIGYLQVAVLAIVILTIWMQSDLWAYIWQLGSPLLTIALIVLLAMLLVCVVLLILGIRAGGRLGGSISLWPWQTKQVEQAKVVQ